MFGRDDFGKDGKRWEENKRENSWEMCLVGRQRERKNWWGPTIFSSSPPNYNLSKIERKQERKLLCMWKEYLAFGASLLILPYFLFYFYFFPSPLTYFFYSLWTSFSSSFILWFLVSSCIPFYASIFFSLLLASFHFLSFFIFFIYSILLPIFASIFFLFFFLNWRICFSFLEYGCS